MDDDRGRLKKFSADFKDRYDDHYELVVDETSWKYMCPLNTLIDEWESHAWWSTLPESGLTLDEQISELDEQYATIKRYLPVPYTTIEVSAIEHIYKSTLTPLLKHYFLNISSGFITHGLRLMMVTLLRNSTRLVHHS